MTTKPLDVYKRQKYNKEGGFIQVTLSYDENKDFVLLKVKDNGKGISKEKQKMLFKRFYEGDYRKFNTIGTGIGLSLTKDLVEMCIRDRGYRISYSVPLLVLLR